MYASPSKKYFKAAMALSMVDINEVFDYFEEWKDDLTNSLPIHRLSEIEGTLLKSFDINEIYILQRYFRVC